MVYTFLVNILIIYLTMISEVLRDIAHWFGTLGYWGVFISGFGVFSIEITTAMMGANNPNSLLKISLVAALGEAIGFLPTYFLGYYLRNKNILKFLNKNGRFLHISEKSYNTGFETFKKKGSIYIFFSRFVPWLRVLTSLIAGYVKYNVLILSVAIILPATFIYTYVFAYVGAEIGDNWEQIKKVIDTFNNATLGLIVIGIIVYLYVNREKFFKRRSFS
jgi:membrane protein DedA with SNARE-associated domain